MKKNLAYMMPSMLSGTALVFCFPNFDLGFMAFFALFPFLVSLYGKSNRSAFLSGFLLGLPYFFGTNYWVYHSISKYGGVNVITSYLLVLLLAMYLSLFTGIFAALYASRIKKTSLPAMLIAPVLWVVLEYLRSFALTGYPYSLIGYTQYGFLEFIQIADLTGVYGVSFLVLAVNGALADFFILKRRTAEMPLFHKNHTVIGYILLAIALGATMMYGTEMLDKEVTGKPLNTVIVQPNIEQNIKWDPAYQGEVLKTLETLTRKTVTPETDLIIWPETALPFYYERDKENTRRFRSFVRKISKPLLTGTITVYTDKEGEITLGNSAIVMNKKGKEAFRYGKIHLVPFGEYVPLKKYIGFIDKLVVGIGDYRAGDNFSKATVKKKKVASVICYEVAFPNLVRKFFKKDGDALVVITNDAWFGRTTGPYHHVAMSVFRAVENRKPVLRAANTGVSGFIDSRGRIEKSTEIFTRTAINHAVITDNTRSVYSRFGDLFIYLCTIVTIILMADLRRTH